VATRQVRDTATAQFVHVEARDGGAAHSRRRRRGPGWEGAPGSRRWRREDWARRDHPQICPRPPTDATRSGPRCMLRPMRCDRPAPERPRQARIGATSAHCPGHARHGTRRAAEHTE
jgi:hypothetical protein